MNPETGQIFNGEAADRAVAAGEAFYVSEEVAEAVTIGKAIQERRRRRQQKAQHQTRPKTKAHFPRW